MFGRNRNKGETLPPLRTVSAVPAEGRTNTTRVIFDVGVDKPYVICGIPIRPIGLGVAYREMIDTPPAIHPDSTIEQMADFVINGSIAQPEQP